MTNGMELLAYGHHDVMDGKSGKIRNASWMDQKENNKEKNADRTLLNQERNFSPYIF